MNRLKRVDEELSGFIVFGEMMTLDLRRLVAEMLFLTLYDPGYVAMPALEDTVIPTKYPHWYRLLKTLLKEDHLSKLTRNNEDFSLSVAKETLNWCKKMALRFTNQHAYVDEEQQFSHLEHHPDETEPVQWETALSQLTARYPQHNKSWTFYQNTRRRIHQQLDQTSSSTETRRLREELRVLKQNIIQDWGHFLVQKKSLDEEALLDEAFREYHHEILHKANQLSNMSEQLAPFYHFLGHAWNDSLGAWNKIDWDKLEEYAENMEKDPHLRELAVLLGRWDQAEREIEEERLQAPLPDENWKPNPYGKSEIIGIHYSDLLSAMLPSEIALLTTPETELILSKKYVEKKLLTFQYRSRDVDHDMGPEEVISQQVETDNRGPIILCIDTSGSMFGRPEQIAKALSLAILNIALEDNRKAYLISFSTGITTKELNGVEKNISEMVEFLRLSFHGGTDLQPALREAMKMLKERRYEKADVLVISDFRIPRLDRNLYEDIQAQRKEAGTHFHSLFITRRPDSAAASLNIFDNHWVYDLDNPRVIRQTIDHFKELEMKSKS